MKITGVHPYADKFPMLADDEHEALRESIKENGLRNPVVTDTEGRLIDGRNRSKACEELGIEPDITVYEGNDIAEYVIDCNVTRRNMSTGARAMSTGLVMFEAGLRVDGKWDGAKGRGIIRGRTSTNSESSWVKALTQVGTVLDYKPDLAQPVAFGDMTLNDAFEQARAIKDSDERDKIMERERKKREKQEAAEEAERNARIIADLEQAESKYLPMIEDGTMTPPAAWAAHNADHRKEQERLRAERQNDEEQARYICKILDTLRVVEYQTQRDWFIETTKKYPEAMEHYSPENHTPARIHQLADALHTYANELEASNAA